MAPAPVRIDHWRRASRAPHERRRRHRRLWNAVTDAAVVGAAAGGALAGCHPTGTPVLDPLYAGLLAAAVALAAEHANRVAVLALCVAGVVLSRGGMLIPALAAVVVAFAATFPPRPPRAARAVAGALAVQAVLRWPPERFQGLTALVAAAVLIPCLLSGGRQLPGRARRWLLIGAGVAALVVVIVVVPVGIEGLEAHADVSRGIEATEGALSGLTDGGDSSDRAQLAAAAGDFGAASGHAGSWLTLGARLVPIAAQQRQALAGATAVARQVTTVAAREAGTVDLGRLDYTDGRIDLAAITALDGPLGLVDRTLSSATRQLAGLRSGWLVSPIQSRLGLIDTQIVKAAGKATLADQVVRAAPAILGGDGVRHYFIAFMTPSESRGLDGFIGAYGELTVDNGRLHLTRSGSIDELNDGYPAGTRHLTGPRDYLARYGAFDPQDHFQDLTYSPDMPTVTQVIAQLYPQSGGDHIDGVLALDPEALAALLGIIGPIDVPGLGTLTSTNAAEVLLKGQYASFPAGNQQGARHDYLQNALQLAFTKLSSGTLPGPQSLAVALDPEVRDGHLLFWSLHPADQAVLRRVGLAGAFPAADGGDLLAVTTQNAANNKIDAYLQRTIRDHVTFDPATGATTATVTISLHNEAPASGLPSDVLGSYPGSGLPSGTNRTWLSVYSPLDLAGARDASGAVAMDSVPELGVQTYSAYVDVPPGGTVTLTLRLAGRTRAATTYDLALRRQPLVLPDRVQVDVAASRGWALEGPATWTPGDSETVRRSFAFRRSP